MLLIQFIALYESCKPKLNINFLKNINIYDMNPELIIQPKWNEKN